jgi:hypothetical protein
MLALNDAEVPSAAFITPEQPHLPLVHQPKPLTQYVTVGTTSMAHMVPGAFRAPVQLTCNRDCADTAL